MAGDYKYKRVLLKLSGEDAERCIIEFKKTKRTPDIYPRRYAVIKVKPL